MSGRETGHKKLVKKIVNGYPMCNNVQRIAKDCRATNRKFRDIKFDIENDTSRCLYGLFMQTNEKLSPANIHRVTQIFDNPQLFVGAPGLVEKFCVTRDEKVGVYGFIFFRDNAWVTVIIDELVVPFLS
ncbi:hypothetical protein BYT27DRAFT_7263722 [Phlegmacium glaucopus]|nr:hypothetical protein BYT27DRAFT_7263722 [Phlegmacium glaucopus]